MSPRAPTIFLLAFCLPLLSMSCSTQRGARGEQGPGPGNLAAGDDDSDNSGQQGDDDSGHDGNAGDDDDSGHDGNAGDDDSTLPPAQQLHGQVPAQPLSVASFEALNSDGATRSTPDLLGHPTVLWFFPYAGTPV